MSVLPNKGRKRKPFALVVPTSPCPLKEIKPQFDFAIAALILAT
ncbi:MAG: hypothetical protein RMX97_18130 [Nostoc sp. DedQUE11]|nr:hypothetical protein [Nostoc sp. DedQUE11]